MTVRSLLELDVRRLDHIAPAFHFFLQILRRLFDGAAERLRRQLSEALLQLGLAQETAGFDQRQRSDIQRLVPIDLKTSND